MTKLRDVTDQEYIFLDHFVRTGDKIDSYNKAYPAPGGRTRRSALSSASKVLARPAVRAEKDKMVNEFRARMRISREQHTLNLVRLRDQAEKASQLTDSFKEKNALIGTALRAEQAIGKALGYAEQKIKIEREVDASRALEQLSAMIESSPALASVLRKKVGPSIGELIPQDTTPVLSEEDL